MLRNVIDNIHVSINIFDKDGKRIFVNPHYYYLSGKKPGTKVAAKFNSEKHWRKDALLDEKIKDVIQTGKVFNIHNDPHRSNATKTRRYLDILMGPICDEKGKIIGAYSMAQDATARYLRRKKIINLNKNLEKTVQERTEKLEKANKKLKKSADDKNILLSDVAHEIKTILTIIKGNMDLMGFERRLEDPLLMECNSEIQREIHRMSKIISDLVFITKAEVYGNLFRMEKIKPTEIIKSCVKEFKKINNNNKNFKIIVSARDKKAPTMIGDKSKIRTLTENMIENAIKYGRKNGTLRISVFKEETKVRINFKDDGQGIDQEKLDYIFEPFFQVKKTRDSKIVDRGFGMGLAICKKIVAGHKGEISVNSELGKGTEFKITFPQQ